MKYHSGADGWKLTGTVDYTIASGFAARLAVAHDTTGPGATEGFLRFERSF